MNRFALVVILLASACGAETPAEGGGGPYCRDYIAAEYTAASGDKLSPPMLRYCCDTCPDGEIECLDYCVDPTD